MTRAVCGFLFAFLTMVLSHLVLEVVTVFITLKITFPVTCRIRITKSRQELTKESLIVVHYN